MLARAISEHMTLSAVVTIVSAALTFLLYSCLFYYLHPDYSRFESAESGAFVITGKSLTPVSTGNHQIQKDSFVALDFNKDEIILLADVNFPASRYPFIKVDAAGISRYSKVKLLWRNSENPEQIHGVSLPVKNGRPIQLSLAIHKETYTGLILDFALLIYDGPEAAVNNNAGEAITINKIEFRPLNPANILSQVISEWAAPKPWQGNSNNIVAGSSGSQLIQPNAATNIVLCLAVLLATIYKFTLRQVCGHARTTSLRKVILGVLLICLSFNEVLRFQWRVEMFSDTIERYFNSPLETRILHSEIRCSRDAGTCYSYLLPFF